MAAEFGPASVTWLLLSPLLLLLLLLSIFSRSNSTLQVLTQGDDYCHTRCSPFTTTQTCSHRGYDVIDEGRYTRYDVTIEGKYPGTRVSNEREHPGYHVVNKVRHRGYVTNNGNYRGYDVTSKGQSGGYKDNNYQTEQRGYYVINERNIHISGFIPMHGWDTEDTCPGQGILTAVIMALDAVYRSPKILKGYRLLLGWQDTKVSEKYNTLAMCLDHTLTYAK